MSLVFIVNAKASRVQRKMHQARPFDDGKPILTDARLFSDAVYYDPSHVLNTPMINHVPKQIVSKQTKVLNYKDATPSITIGMF